MAGKRGRPKKKVIEVVGSSVSTSITPKHKNPVNNNAIATPPPTVQGKSNERNLTEHSKHGDDGGKIGETVQGKHQADLNRTVETIELAENDQFPELQPTAELAKEVEKGQKPDPVGNWANLFVGNRKASNGLSLTYIPPVIVNGNTIAQLDKGETEKAIDKWKHALIVYVIGETVGYNAMKKFIEFNWSTAAAPEVYLTAVIQTSNGFQLLQGEKEDIEASTPPYGCSNTEECSQRIDSAAGDWPLINNAYCARALRKPENTCLSIVLFQKRSGGKHCCGYK